MSHDLAESVPSDSFLEWAFLKWVLSPASLPGIESVLRPQAEVTSAGGSTYRIDYGIVGTTKRIAVELDGFQFHGSRPAFTHDRLRQNELVNDGWQPLRFTYDSIRSDVRRCVEQTHTALLSDPGLARYVNPAPMIVQPEMDPDPLYALRPPPNRTPTNWFETARSHLSTATLRDCQQRALGELGNYYSRGGRRAATVMSVGAGKTALGVAASVAFARRRALIVTPGSVIRGAFDSALDPHNPRNVLYTLPNGPLIPGLTPPIVRTLDRDAGPISKTTRADLLAADFIVTNFHALGSADDPDALLAKLDPDDIDFIVIDEAHIAASDSYLRLFDHFTQARFLLMSACFQRADGKPLEADVVYRYRLIDSIADGHAKNLRTVRFEAEDDASTYEIVWPDGRREELRGRAALLELLGNERKLARVTARSTAPLRELMRQTRAALDAQQNLLHPVKPRVLFSAMGAKHAQQVADLANAEGIPTATLHYSMSDAEIRAVRHRFESDTGDLQGIVQLKMLGQGYDFPPVTVVVPLRPYGSFGEFYQFIGRGVRAIHHPDLDARMTAADQILDIIFHADLGLDDHIETIRIENDMDPSAGQEPPPEWALEDESTVGDSPAAQPEAFVLFQPGSVSTEVMHDARTIRNAQAELLRDERETMAFAQAYADYASGRADPVTFDQFIEVSRGLRR